MQFDLEVLSTSRVFWQQHRDRKGVRENAGLHDQPVQPH